MDKSEEYKMLREEILQSMQVVKNYRTLVYTITVAILAFAFDKGESILFLIPFCAIIPLYLLAMHQIDSTMRIGAYIYVFIEPETECKWETRLYNYDCLHKNEYSTKKSSVDPYWVTGLCCLLFSVLSLDFCHRGAEFYFTLLLQLLVVILSGIVFLTKRVDYISTKEKYISEWQEIQKREKQ